MGKSYLPKSPLSALLATEILAGFGADFMSNHAFGRGTVAVPIFWIDTLVPQARFILQAVRVRNHARVGKPDLSGQHTVESVLYLVLLDINGLRRKNVTLPPHSSSEPPDQIKCEASSNEDLGPRLSISLPNTRRPPASVEH